MLGAKERDFTNPESSVLCAGPRRTAGLVDEKEHETGPKVAAPQRPTAVVLLHAQKHCCQGSSAEEPGEGDLLPGTAAIRFQLRVLVLGLFEHLFAPRRCGSLLVRALS